MTDSIRCCECSRVNDPWRRYCGDCGEILQPGCRCGFANGRHDRYCGGCGSSIRISYANLTAAATIPRARPAGLAESEFETKTTIRGPVFNQHVSTQQIETFCDIVAIDPET